MKNNIQVPITVDVNGVQTLLGVGRNKAREIGERAGAVIHLSSRRVLYNVEKIKSYMDSITRGGGAGNEDTME